MTSTRETRLENRSEKLCILLIHVACLWMCVLIYSSFLRLHVCAYAFKFKVHCGSALGPGASGLPYYCTPFVTVPDVIGGLPVWRRHNNPKKNPISDVCTSCMLRDYGCVSCSIPLLFVYLRMCMYSNPRSMAGVPFDSVGILRTTFVLRTTCMHSWWFWIASCLAA